MIYCLTDGTLSTDVTFAGIVAVILAIKYSLTNSNGWAIVVPIASFWLDIAPSLSIIRVSDEVLPALTDCDMVFRSANAILAAQGGSATWKTALDTIAVYSTDLIIPAIAACATLGDRSAALPYVISKTLKSRPAFAIGLVMHRDAVCVGPTAPVPAWICAVPNANPSQQANGRIGAVVIMLTQMSHAASSEIVRIASEPWETLASCKVVHGNAVCIWPAFVVKTEFNAVLDSYRSDFAYLITFAVKVAVATVAKYWCAALCWVTRVPVVTLPTFADRPVKPSNAVRVRATAGFEAGPRTVFDSPRVRKAAIALCTVCILDAGVEQRLTTPDAVIRIA